MMDNLASGDSSKNSGFFSGLDVGLGVLQTLGNLYGLSVYGKQVDNAEKAMNAQIQSNRAAQGLVYEQALNDARNKANTKALMRKTFNPNSSYNAKEDEYVTALTNFGSKYDLG